jgi:hypothetical protein
MDALQAEFARLVERQDAAVASADAAVAALAAAILRAAPDAALDTIVASCRRGNNAEGTPQTSASRQPRSESFKAASDPMQEPTPMDGVEELAADAMDEDTVIAPTIEHVGDQLRKGVKNLQKSIASEAKDVATRLGKFSKLIDTHAGADLSAVVAPDIRVTGEDFNIAVSAHLYRAAMFDVADVFSAAANVSIRSDEIQPFETLHLLLSSFRAGNVAPAIEWARAHREKLAAVVIPSTLTPPHQQPPRQASSGGLQFVPPASSSSSSESDSSASSAAPMAADDLDRSRKGYVPVAIESAAQSDTSHRATSRLEFCLHRLHYLDVVQRGVRDDALQYARHHLVQFVHSHLFDVQKLMACLLYAPNIAESPYKSLVSGSERQSVERLLGVEYCRVMGITVESPLLSVVRCGAIALPVLLKASRVSPPWKGLDMDYALPVEIETGRDCQHHSIFTCPVSREEATGGNNVPMILPCGHVLSKQSISRLPRGNPRFKCPYCPMEQLQAECKPVYF